MSELQNIIVNETKKILVDKGKAPQLISSISGDTVFLEDLEMDSLDLATLIVTLELTLERDPFKQGFKTFETVSELTELYEQCPPDA